MSCCSILRIGPIGSESGNAALLRNAISEHFANLLLREDDEGKRGTLSNDILTISNRYFKADVLIAGLDYSAENVIGAEQFHTQEDGIILVFDSVASSPSTSFDSLGPIHDASEKLDRAGDLLRLCVGVAFGPSPLSDGTKKSEQEYSRRVLWCLDRGYEYVEADLTDEGIKKGHNERDKDGFARIIEAISSCMWSSHVMKNRSTASKTLEQTPNSPSATRKEEMDDVTYDTKEYKTQHTSSDETREAAAMASLMKGVDSELNMNGCSPEEAEEHREQEVSFHELEHVIMEAKRIREASKGNSMTDEERRQRAGDTAVRLMELMGKIGLGDDEETEASSIEDGSS